MPVVNRIASFASDMTGWRRDLHQIPELGLDCHKTARFIAERLQAFGVDEIHENIASTGIVAVIHGRGAGATIGLRADMDGLPIMEATGLSYASQHEGCMHACGHDGHSSMLLGAARYLAETRNFTGKVVLIFQPAEENLGGARIMVEEGIIERFDIAQVYALHNAPNLPVGSFETQPGPMMAAVDEFHIHVKGLGGHGATPHETRDPVMAACGMAQAIQTIISRNARASDELVVSVTQIHAGTVDNVIPETAFINGTVRSFDRKVQALVQRRMGEIVSGQAASYGVEATLDYEIGYPPTVNDAAKCDFAMGVASQIVGSENTVPHRGREMYAEDFGYMLEKCPGAYVALGQGESEGLHNDKYDFNDEILPLGASFFARLVETAQPVERA